MKIGNLNLKNDILLAPIAGFSDVGMRTLCVRYGAALTYTEMVSAKGLFFNKTAAEPLLFTSEEETVKAVQIFGSEEEYISYAVANEALSKFNLIDINMGCPVRKIVSNFEGSYLMKQTDRIYAITKAAVDAANGRPVTVKLRAGFDEEHKNAVEAALAAQEGGASAVTVHGRTREQFYSGRADWDVIKNVKAALNIPVIGNGDVVERDDYLRMKEYCGVDGIMVARAALGKPFIFSKLLNIPYEYDIIEAVRTHLSLLGYLPERVAVSNMKKQIAFYVKGLRNQKRVKEAAFAAKDKAELLASLDYLQQGE